MTITDWDDLEDPNFANPTAAPAERPKPAYSELGGHWENCPKCGGSGQTRWGVCFACQGKGGKTYKTDRATRVKAKFQREERAFNKTEENLTAFREGFPDEWAWISSRITWEAGDHSRGTFGQSLREGIAKYGSLTDKQLDAVRTNIAKRAAAIAARPARSTEIDVSGLDAAFAVAREKGAVKAVLRTATVTFSLASLAGKNPGAVYAKDHRGEYLGKIKDGVFSKSFACTAAQVEEVVEASRDPKAAALRFAAQTGRCSVCDRELTDPISVANGIGPICADKFGW